MSILKSYLWFIRKMLKLNGYKQKPGWRHRAGADIFVGPGRAVVTVDSIAMDPTQPDSVTIKSWFEKLLEILKGASCGHVVFEGGGTVPIPAWFREECKQLGITIHVVDGDNAEQVARQITADAYEHRAS